MENAWKWMKEHPYATAGIVAALGLILVYFMFSGSSSSSSGNTAASDAAAQAQALAAQAASGNELAAQQAQLQAATNQTNAQVAANAADNSTAQTVASIQSQTQMNADQLSAQVAVAQTNAAATTAQYSAQSAEVASTTSAQVNATNTSATVLQNLFDTAASDVTTGQTLDGMTVNGNFTLAGTPSSFSVSSQATPVAPSTAPASSITPVSWAQALQIFSDETLTSRGTPLTTTELSQPNTNQQISNIMQTSLTTPGYGASVLAAYPGAATATEASVADHYGPGA